MSDFWQEAMALEQAREAFVVATLISSRGHVPQDPGAKILVTQRGRHWGTIGGGKLEARVIEKCREILKIPRPNPMLFEWNLTLDIGMSCGGIVQILFEAHQPLAWRICIFGSGHIAQALVRILTPLPCQIAVYDHRTEWLDRLPKERNLQTHALTGDSSVIRALSPNGYFLVMTMGHTTDLPVLHEIFKSHPRATYVGVIGSTIKAQKMKNDLMQRGHSAELLEGLHSPMGLKLGGNQPHEIAISIAAELLLVRDREIHLRSTDKQSAKPSQRDTEPTSI